MEFCTLILLFCITLIIFVIFFLVKPCRYNNQTFGINESIITSNCQERCRCDFHNGVTIPTCRPICKSEIKPKCDPHSQVLKEYQTILNDTSCTCTGKKCVGGLILLSVLKKVIKSKGCDQDIIKQGKSNTKIKSFKNIHQYIK